MNESTPGRVWIEHPGGRCGGALDADPYCHRGQDRREVAIEAAGWGRMTGSADETFAWSSWLIPDSGDWRGVLLVLAAFPGVRHLSVQAERIPPGGRRSGGGYAVRFSRF